MTSTTLSNENEETAEIAPETQENSEEQENPSRVGKMKAFLARALSVYHTFLTIIIPLCVLLLFGKVVYELVQNDLIVKPFDVPVELEAQGYSGTVIVNKLLDYMGEIKRDLKEERDQNVYKVQGKGRQSSIQLEEVGEEQSIAVPGTGLSLEAIISHVRDLLNISPRYIKGDIVIDRKLLREDELRITIRITGKPFKTFKDSEGNLEALLKKAAKYLLMNLEPLTLGMEYCDNEEKEEELRSLIRYIQKNNPSPHEKAIAFTLQVCLLEWEDSEMGLEVLKKAIELDPENSTAFHLIGDILYWNQDKYKEAIVPYEKALELEPKNIYIYMQLGSILLRLGKFEEAKEKYKEALEVNPESAAKIHTRWVNFLSIWESSLEEEVKYKYKEEKFKTALKEDPSYVWAHIDLGELLDESGKHEEALVEYEKAAKKVEKLETEDARNASIHFNLAELFWNMEKKEKAIAGFKKAVELNPEAIGYRGQLGQVLLSVGRNEEAIAEYKKAVELKPETTWVHSALAEALLEIGKKEEAIAQYKKLVKLKPKDTSYRTELGNVLLEVGRKEEAIAEYKKAVELEPEKAWVHSSLGEALLKVGKREEAIAKLKKAIELEPKNARSRRGLGEALLRIGKKEEAVAQLEKAMELYRKNIEEDNSGTYFPAKSYLNLGDILIVLKRKEEAIAQYEKALELTEGNSGYGYGYEFEQQAKEKLESLKATKSSDSDLKSLNE